MFLQALRRRRPASPPTAGPAARAVLIEWSDGAGERFRQETHLESDRLRGLTVMVRQEPPLDTVAQIREGGSSYPVVVLSTNVVEGGFELRVDYLWEGRRREQRTAVRGPATLKAEGLAEMQVEVINVSAGGMQIFSVGAVLEGSQGRICGTDTEQLCFVRSCSAVPGGYFLGLQFFGENRREKTYGAA